MKLMSKYFPHISGRSEERDVRSGLQTEAERLSVLLLTLSETGLHQLWCGKRGGGGAVAEMSTKQVDLVVRGPQNLLRSLVCLVVRTRGFTEALR